MNNDNFGVCPAHSGVAAQYASIDARLANIEKKVECIPTLGKMTNDHRSWLSWLTGIYVVTLGAAVRFMIKGNL